MTKVKFIQICTVRTMSGLTVLYGLDASGQVWDCIPASGNPWRPVTNMAEGVEEKEKDE